MRRVVANISPAQAGKRAEIWRKTGRTVIDLFESHGSMSLAA